MTSNYLSLESKEIRSVSSHVDNHYFNKLVFILHIQALYKPFSASYAYNNPDDIKLHPSSSLPSIVSSFTLERHVKLETIRSHLVTI